MENVEYLYHYTNIETLALILKNRTIRFNSLDRMDDLQKKLRILRTSASFSTSVHGQRMQQKVYPCGICMHL